MKGVILAAGIGKRLRPLTKNIPKALIPLKNKPMIFYVVSNFKKAGIKDICVVINPKDKVKFQSALDNFKININYTSQLIANGSANALKTAEGFVKTDTFLLSWCDNITPFDYQKIIQAHKEYSCDATMLINKEKDPKSTAQVLYKGDLITKIAEKPKTRFSFWGSAGLMVIEPEFFSYIHKIKPTNETEHHIASVLQYWINQGKKIHFIKLNTWRVNVNTIRDIKLVEKLILRPGGPWG
ncbi:MAG: sugar nucleotidyltransferase [Candidatus Omnitrophica bacterium]|nr:sugar nucleotidyltransferase [Candidatus Omnitrophota bacterium]